METPTIEIKVNRIHFEDFPAPCGEPERTEIRLAWERAVIDEIEKAGFLADIELCVDKDPYEIGRYVVCEEVNCDESDDGECYASLSCAELAKFVERYGLETAIRAVAAGDEAAQQQSDEFVAASESASQN